MELPVAGDEYLFDRSFRMAPDPTSAVNGRPATRWFARLSTGFEGEPGRPIGSYVVCVALRALLAYSTPLSFPDPVSLHADFYASPPLASIVSVELRERKRGRRYLFVDADVVIKNGNDTQVFIACHGIFGNLPDLGRRQIVAQRHRSSAAGPTPDLRSTVDPIRALFGTRKRLIKEGDPSVNDTAVQLADKARMSSLLSAGKLNPPEAVFQMSEGVNWVLHPDGRECDIYSVTFFCDGPPANMLAAADSRAPSTLSLAIQYYAKPSGRKLQRTIVAGLAGENGDDGVADVECCIWDESGEHVLCLARQTVHLAKLTGEKLQFRMQQISGKL